MIAVPHDRRGTPVKCSARETTPIGWRSNRGIRISSSLLPASCLSGPSLFYPPDEARRDVRRRIRPARRVRRFYEGRTSGDPGLTAPMRSEPAQHCPGRARMCCDASTAHARDRDFGNRHAFPAARNRTGHSAVRARRNGRLHQIPLRPPCNAASGRRYARSRQAPDTNDEPSLQGGGPCCCEEESQNVRHGRQRK
jgi:hypothetical protein